MSCTSKSLAVSPSLTTQILWSQTILENSFLMNLTELETFKTQAIKLLALKIMSRVAIEQTYFSSSLASKWSKKIRGNKKAKTQTHFKGSSKAPIWVLNRTAFWTTKMLWQVFSVVTMKRLTPLLLATQLPRRSTKISFGLSLDQLAHNCDSMHRLMKLLRLRKSP